MFSFSTFNPGSGLLKISVAISGSSEDVVEEAGGVLGSTRSEGVRREQPARVVSERRGTTNNNFLFFIVYIPILSNLFYQLLLLSGDNF